MFYVSFDEKSDGYHRYKDPKDGNNSGKDEEGTDLSQNGGKIAVKWINVIGLLLRATINICF